MNRLSLVRLACSLILCVVSLSTSAHSNQVIVLASTDEAIGWLEAQDWWGEENRDEQLTVPPAMLVDINPAWRQAAQQLPVLEKKEIFSASCCR